MKRISERLDHLERHHSVLYRIGSGAFAASVLVLTSLITNLVMGNALTGRDLVETALIMAALFALFPLRGGKKDN